MDFTLPEQQPENPYESPLPLSQVVDAEIVVPEKASRVPVDDDVDSANKMLFLFYLPFLIVGVVVIVFGVSM